VNLRDQRMREMVDQRKFGPKAEEQRGDQRRQKDTRGERADAADGVEKGGRVHGEERLPNFSAECPLKNTTARRWAGRLVSLH
jgi:hypothetical protein